MDRLNMLETVETIAREAGDRILSFYDADMGITYKDDRSPLTKADRAAHQHIAAELHRHYPEVPVISEEGRIPDARERARMDRFFLVDPLDGTKEFIKKNGEFTVNIALIEDGRSVLGVVGIPVARKYYRAASGAGASLSVGDGPHRPLRCAPFDSGRLRVASSRSHPSGKLAEFLDSFPGLVQKGLGSSLKFCFIAEGAVDFYPRFGVINEWDTAAAHHILEEAGGVVTDLEGAPLVYNKPVMKHFGFLATSSRLLTDLLLERMPEVEIVDDRA